MSLRRKLFLSFTIVFLLVAVQGALSLLVLMNIVADTALLVDPALTRVDRIAHADGNLVRLRSLEHSLFMSRGSADSNQYAADIGNIRASLEKFVREASILEMNQEQSQTFASIAYWLPLYFKSLDKTLGASASGNYADAQGEYLRFQEAFQVLESQLHTYRHQEYAAIAGLREDMVSAEEFARWPLAMVVALIALCEIGLGWYLAHAMTRSLGLFQQGAQRIAQDNFAEPVPIPSEAELAAVAATLNSLMDTLVINQAEKASLEEQRLQLWRDRLNQTVRAQEEERARISRELHDQAGQALVALQYGLTRLQPLTKDAMSAAEVQRLLILAADAGRQIRSLAVDLRPAILDDLGLIPALRSYIREFSERIGISVEFSLLNSPPRMPRDVETTLFRVVQEALTNIGKHAQTDHAMVTLTIKDGQLQLMVQDDGVGFDTEDVEHESRGRGLGLAGIQERVRLLNGTFSIKSKTGQGTRLLVAVPILKVADAP